jgi:dehydratase ilvD1
MAEVGNMPIPRRLVEQGVRDMVRISDARMSGTAFGTVVLHVSPEAFAGGPLAIVRTGDRIKLDAFAGELQLLISDEELAARMAAWQPPENQWKRGYYKLYYDTVLQAHQGADLDFLVGKSGDAVTRESH